MIRGIGNIPYIDLDPHIDLGGFKSLHYKICKGLVLSKNKKEGNLVKPGGFDNAYKLNFKPFFQAIEEYNSLPETHEIRILGKEIGEYKNRDQFMLFLKLVLGAYDPYQFIFLKNDDNWSTRFDEKNWTSDSEFFPELKIWLENLKGSVFEHLGRIIFFKAEHDCLSPLHRDLILPNENDYFNHRHEFIHIRPNLDKPFYIWDGIDKLIPILSHASFFNDQDWHSGGRVNIQTYSLRIDGVFTDAFRKKIGINHLEFY
jgi:hypothetical protein